jgi:hypothetical protein
MDGATQQTGNKKAQAVQVQELVLNWSLIGVVIIGLGLILAGVNIWMQSEMLRNWVEVPGKVSAAGRVTQQSTVVEGGGVMVDDGRSEFDAQVRYTYVYKGQEYSSASVSLLKATANSLNEADQAAKKYPLGTVVHVYVNPYNPEESILENGIKSSMFIFVSWGMIFAFVGSVGFFYSAYILKFVRGSNTDLEDGFMQESDDLNNGPGVSKEKFTVN